MTWLSSFGWIEWAILGAIPPLIVLLYFLKLRRKPLEVPSTFLWKRAVEDMRVNSLWQRLRQNLLLYLQLLFVVMLILACLRPGIHGTHRSGERWIFLVDQSASMRASDVAPSRLANAKHAVREKLNTMKRNDVAMLMAFSNVADVKQGFTSDKQKLLNALESIEPTNRTTEISESLRAAAGLANPGRASFDGINDVAVAEALPATLYLVTDGGFPTNSDFDFGNLTPQYLPIGGTQSDNLAIVGFSVDRDSERPSAIEAFGRIYNDSREPVVAPVSLYFNGELIDSTRVSVAPKEVSGVNFQLSEILEGELKLEVERDDILPLDNVAFAALRPPRQANVLLITPGNRVLETALSTSQLQRFADVTIQSPDFMQSSEYEQAQRRPDYDLIIFDQCQPAAMPGTNTLFIGGKPPSPDWSLGELTGPIFIEDWDKSHPIMQFVEMGTVRIIEGQSVHAPSGGKDLMTGNIGAVFSVAPRGPFQDAVLGFRIVQTLDTGGEVNTDWGIRRSFPVFVFGAVEYLTGGSTVAAANSVLPGQAMALTLSSRHSRFEVETPQGKRLTIERGKSGQFVFTQTETPGMYRVFAEGGTIPLEVFCVNLFSQRESKLDTVPELSLGVESIQATSMEIEQRKEFWRWLVAIALAILFLEWIIYNRRVLI